VHWASSARTDHLMIRQEQTVLQGRLLLMADLRADIHTSESLEAALGALASLVDAALRTGIHVRLVTSAGLDTGYGVSVVHRGAILDVLAGVAAHPSAPIGPVLARLGRDRGGSMVLVTTDGARSGDIAAFGRVGLRAVCRAVIIDRGLRSRPLGVGDTDAAWASVHAVRIPYGTPFASTWERAVRTAIFDAP
jgi:uncharacterized protein (DUF58 family)